MFDIDSYFSNVLNSPQLFKCREVLTPEYVPSQLLHRDDQQRKIAEVISTSFRSCAPSNLFLIGKTGSGKTATIKYVLDRLENTFLQANLKVPHWIYLNCQEVNTEYRLFARIAQSLDPDDPIPIAGWPLDAVFNKTIEKIEQYCCNSVCFIILDEIDIITKKTNNKSSGLYNLIRINERLNKGKVSIIGISNVLNFKDTLDPRVLSSLRDETILFPSYNASELFTILMQRVKDGFIEGAIHEDVVLHCAHFAAKEHGDARKAIDVLRKAGELTERQNMTQITKLHIESAQKDLEQSGIKDFVANLPVQMKLILLSVYLIEKLASQEEISTGLVYRCYIELLNQTNDVSELTQRRVSSLINDLDLSGLINASTVSKGRAGRTKKIKLAISLKDVEDAFICNSKYSTYLNYRPLCLRTDKAVRIKNAVYRTLDFNTTNNY
jgi:cell division control protein 6